MRIVDFECENRTENPSENRIAQCELPNIAPHYACNGEHKMPHQTWQPCEKKHYHKVISKFTPLGRGGGLEWQVLA